MKRVAVIGHFGIGVNLSNGQTIKTKIITENIEKKINETVFKVDTHGGIKSLISILIGCTNSLKKCENIIIMLTENGLRVCVPFLIIMNSLFKRRLHYIVIGGWLSGFLNKHRILENQLKKFNAIYVETKTMQEAMETKGFTNIFVMPNCKELKILSSEELCYQTEKPLRICTFSRVMKEKGIEILVDVINSLKNQDILFKLDIYGPIDTQQVEWFNSIQKKFSQNINYRGVIPFDQSVEVLKKYFLLIFPTLFFTEGIPGTIIDGYASGVPVLSAKWESFNDVIDEQITGFGYDFNNTQELANTLIYCYKNITKVNEMKINCLSKSKEFTTDYAMKVLFKNLSEGEFNSGS